MAELTFHRVFVAIGITGWAIGCVGCGKSVATASQPDVNRPAGSSASAPKIPKARVSNRPGDTNSGVLILMYHKFEATETRFDRSFAHFASDLKRLYDMDFRPVTATEYLDGKMDLAPGASPVVMTFDDSNPDQFALLPDGSIDPNSGVGVWFEFAKTHPDFPVKGTWFVLPGVMWHQRPQREKKIEMLKSWGSELANHTWYHPYLNKVDDHEVMHQFAKAIDFLARYGFDNPPLAYPFGVKPNNMALVKAFDFEGKHYTIRAAFGITGKLAPAPGTPDADLYDIPRIDAGEGGVDSVLRSLEKGRLKTYVEP